MIIKDILADSAMLLGLTTEADAINHASLEEEMEAVNTGEVRNLINILKLTLREVCIHYVPYVKSQTISTTNRQIHLSILTNFISMKGAYRKGEKVKCRMLDRLLTFEEDGEYTIEYLSYPTTVSLFEEITFLDNCSPTMLVYGVSAYYSLSKGLFEEFESFYDKFKNFAELSRERNCFNLPMRRWE